jgi:hypothetical protein
LSNPLKNELERYLDEELIPQLQGRLWTPEGEAEALHGIDEALAEARRRVRARLDELAARCTCQHCAHFCSPARADGLRWCPFGAGWVAPRESCSCWCALPQSEAPDGK